MASIICIMKALCMKKRHLVKFQLPNSAFSTQLLNIDVDEVRRTKNTGGIAHQLPKSDKKTQLLAATQAQRHFALRLYRAIMMTHRRVLDPIMRDMGDTYVRDEFKRHKNAKPEYLHGFFEQWLLYLQHLKEGAQIGAIGRTLTEQEQNALNGDQRKQLETLQEETLKIEQMWDNALQITAEDELQLDDDALRLLRQIDNERRNLNDK